MTAARAVRPVHCIECARPWGVILPRRFTPDEETAARETLTASFIQWCTDVWRDDVSTTVPLPSMTAPTPDYQQVVFVSDASARWLENIGQDPEIAEADTWNELELLPAWWAKPRARTALRWDCCNLPDPRDHPIADELAETGRHLVSVKEM